MDNQYSCTQPKALSREECKSICVVPGYRTIIQRTCVALVSQDVWGVGIKGPHFPYPLPLLCRGRGRGSNILLRTLSYLMAVMSGQASRAFGQADWGPGQANRASGQANDGQGYVGLYSKRSSVTAVAFTTWIVANNRQSLSLRSTWQLMGWL